MDKIHKTVFDRNPLVKGYIPLYFFKKKRENDICPSVDKIRKFKGNSCHRCSNTHHDV